MELSELPKTSAAGRAAGSLYYFTGKPCKYGHFSNRLSSNKVCTACAKIYLEDWLKKNPEKKKAKVEKYENSEKTRAVRKAWRAKNKDRLNKNRRACAARNPEKEKKRRTEWRLKNPETSRAYTRNRYAKVVGAHGKHIKSDIDALYNKQNGICLCCRVSLLAGYHVDHKHPISKGGGNGPENLQLLCVKCNLKKSNKDYTTWCIENQIKMQS